MDHFTSMRVFLRVVDLGGLSAAAAAEQISPTMAGKHLRYLEDRLGVRLLNRTTRRQSLTEAGQLYYERARGALAEVAAADACVSNLNAAPRGLLRVSAATLFGSVVLTPLVAEYLGRYPDMRIELNLNDRLVDLVEEGIDMAIRIGRLPDSSLIARPLRPYRLIVCAAPVYLARHGTPRMPAELGRHNCMGFLGAWSQNNWTFAHADGMQDVAVAGNFVVNNVFSLRTAACHGLGIVMLPEMVVRADIDAGRLVELLADFAPPDRPLNIVYPFTRQMAPKLRSFVDWLSARLAWPDRTEDAAAAHGE